MNLEILQISGIWILSYLVGGIHFCNIISRAVGKKDLRNIGDTNPGAWNLAFNVSKYWGFFGMCLDVLKGYLPYFFIMMLTGSEFYAIIGSCLAVLGHNYSSYLKFSGGKGIATAMGLFLAINPWSILFFGAGFVGALFLIKNMIWGVFFGILTPVIFLVFYLDSPAYLLLMILVLIIVPKHINQSKSLYENFKFRKERSMKDLFTPKVR
jgi:acyl phosphate:glycerol-3-phosphate acyltransferase